MKKLTEAEMKLMDIIWENNPAPSRRLVELASRLLNWKKSTTYTILKKLEEKEMVENKDATVEYLVTLEEYNTTLTIETVDHYFSGSLPKFLTAFVREKKISPEEVKELESIIKTYKEEADD